VKVLVAVADVAALVKQKSAIDAHARHNTTSVYTAGRIFPMLPEKLSTDLTSLSIIMKTARPCFAGHASRLTGSTSGAK
jgi:exoribonuclease R